MKKLTTCPLITILTLLLAGFTQLASAQFVYKIKADSVMITRDTCTAELIVENSTKSINGFLYNKGNGRTEFRKAVRLNDSTIVIGMDTLTIPGAGHLPAKNGLEIRNNIITLGGHLDSHDNRSTLLDDREINMGEQILRFKGFGSSYAQIYETPGEGVSIQFRSKADFQPPSKISFLDFSDFENPTEGRIFKREDGLVMEVDSGAIRLWDNNGDLNLSRYRATRDDGTTTKALYTDNNGNVKLGTISPGIKRTAINNTGYTVLESDYLIAYTTLTAPRTVTLPSANTMMGHIIIIKDESGTAGTHNITVNVTAGGTIDGVASKAVNTNYGSIELYSNGTKWFLK